MNKKTLPIAAVAVLGVASWFLCVPSAKAQTAPTISTTDITASGLSSSSGLQNAATSMYFQNDGLTLLMIRATGTAVTATIVTQATSMSQAGYGTTALSNQTVSVPANSVVVAGPFPQGRWNNQYGLVAVSLTAVTGVSASALRVTE